MPCVPVALAYNVLGSFVTHFFTTSLQSHLQKCRANIIKDIERFRHAAELAHRENVRRQHAEVIKKIGDNFAELPEETGRVSEMSKVTFPVSSIGMNKNYTFTGRDDVLEQMHSFFTGQDDNQTTLDGQLEAEHFVKRKTSPACCVLHGLAGIGKTQTALEYTYRYRTDYDAMFWIAAEQDWTLTSTYSQISELLGLLDSKTYKVKDDKRQNVAIQKAREWLQSTGEFYNKVQRFLLTLFCRAEMAFDL